MRGLLHPLHTSILTRQQLWAVLHPLCCLCNNRICLGPLPNIINNTSSSSKSHPRFCRRHLHLLNGNLNLNLNRNRNLRSSRAVISNLNGSSILITSNSKLLNNSSSTWLLLLGLWIREVLLLILGRPQQQLLPPGMRLELEMQTTAAATTTTTTMSTIEITELVGTTA
jgi:hypothetical protein